MEAEAPEELGHSTLPRFPEMIMAAIEALNENEGSNISSINSFIESSYADLPPDHSTLLSYHLNAMKQSGEVIMLNDNFTKPDRDVPAPPQKRGRGRPPKANKKHVPETTYVGPSRGRGRPPKVRDPSSHPATKVSNIGSGKPRGRPPKMARTEAAAEEVVAAAGTTKGRGRPPKVKAATVAAVGA